MSLSTAVVGGLLVYTLAALVIEFFADWRRWGR